ncbi:hypothetical protein WI38_12400 [Burkholderia ubonensis]|uniref:Uncharacterized protein n=1 Tax=Burkholderia ubonensis TaxID=101571 RepID=A0A102KP27_9BURK|nr:hypothetical protein [Burkholderia ubonensis]KUZ78610.1 hypothetical protein WI35_03490 [Burkholderia ubonensis]KUZ89003.1 hypothetical protein WI39_21330 [Burkholderia ubonensis]KUZ91548.1 hypothetical protein WI38_12400 [Burkholderia ubonensis]
MTLDDLTTPTWWLTAVIGAVVLKVISDYTKTGIEKALSKGLSAWSSRSKASRARFEADVRHLRSSREVREIYFQREMRIRSQSTFLLIISVLSVATLVLYYLFELAPHLDDWKSRPPLGWSSLVHEVDRVWPLVVVILYCVAMIVAMSGSVVAQIKAQSMSRTWLAATKGLFPRDAESEPTEEIPEV